MKKRILKRLIEAGVFVTTIKLTQIAIICADNWRGEKQYGSEYLIPIIGLLILLLMECD